MVEVDGRDIGLGPQQRVLLAALVLARGQAVSRSRLIDLMWEGETPEGAAATLRAHVLHLRRILEPRRRGREGYEVLVSVGGAKDTSYALRLDDRQVDAQQFVRLAQDARRVLADGDPQGAVRGLDRAMALWDGMALDGVEGRSFAVAEAARLEELRLVAKEDRLEALLTMGRYQEVIDELTTLIGEHPLRERLWAQRILALYRCGRRADALGAYREVYRVLSDELGLEPGHRLNQLHQQVLMADPALEPGAEPHVPVPVPRQLPADVLTFTGREEDVRSLNALLPEDDPNPAQTLVISSVTGTAGVGKTTLAVHWMHQVAHRFPDGQLFVNLRGYARTSPATPDEALSAMLRSLGVAATLIPESQDEKASLYRSLMAGRRILVLLDDAAELEQVRPLLPGSPTCLVVATSRNDLRGLTAFHDAQRIALNVFSEQEAVRLLARTVGEERVRREAEAAAELARLCGYLPLALRISAANLIGSRYRTIADMARDLREGNRLAALNVEGDQDTAVRAAFDLSYSALPDADRRLFRLLGLGLGTDIPAGAAAALAGAGQEETDRILDHLVSRNLLETYSTGRYHFHELVRLYAAERAREEDPPEARDAAQRRMLSWYQNAADGAARCLYGEFYAHFPDLGDDSAGPVRPPEFSDTLTALAWLAEERCNLLALIDHTAQFGPYSFAWQVAHTLHGYLHLMAGGQKVDWLRVASAGLGAAEDDGNTWGQGLMHWSLGNACWETADFAEAIRHSALAEEAMAEAGFPIEQGGALLVLAASLQLLGRIDEARAQLDRCLEVFRSVDHLAGEALAHGQIGWGCMDAGQFAEARDRFARAREVGEKTSYFAVVTFAQWGLGVAHHALGDYEEAARCLERAQAPTTSPPPAYAEEGVLRDLALVCRDRGELQLALKHATAALSVIHRTRRGLFEADVRNVLGSVLMELDDVPGAREHHEAALSEATVSGCRRAESAARVGLARVHRRLGRGGEARSAAESALQVARAAGLPVSEAEALTELARLYLDMGERAVAKERAEEALRTHRAIGHRLGTAHALEILGDVEDAGSDLKAARRAWQEALNVYERIGAPPPEHLVSARLTH